MIVVCEANCSKRVICNSKEEITNIIRRGSEFPEGDEIWIGAADDEYPFLTLLVKEPYACVHYYLNQDGCVWQSYSDFDQEITFLTGHGDDEWTAPGDTIVSLEAALKCMEEFFDSMKRPECIQWQELWEEASSDN